MRQTGSSLGTGHSGRVPIQSPNLLMPHVSLVSNAPQTCYTLPLVSLVYTRFFSNIYFTTSTILTIFRFSTIPVTYLRFSSSGYFSTISQTIFLRLLHFLKRLLIYDFLQFLLLFFDSFQTVIFSIIPQTIFFYDFYVTDVGYSFKLSLSL
jgi:hypothetical protein